MMRDAHAEDIGGFRWLYTTTSKHRPEDKLIHFFVEHFGAVGASELDHSRARTETGTACSGDVAREREWMCGLTWCEWPRRSGVIQKKHPLNGSRHSL